MSAIINKSGTQASHLINNAIVVVDGKTDGIANVTKRPRSVHINNSNNESINLNLRMPLS